MKSIFILLCLGCLSFAYSQGRKSGESEKIQLIGRWKSDFNVFSDESKSTYKIEKVNFDDPYLLWGNFITFYSTTFSTNYSASCGNDCFTTVTGSYKSAGLNRILVYVESINRSGFCADESLSPNKSFGYYILVKTENGFLIKKENQK